MVPLSCPIQSVVTRTDSSAEGAAVEARLSTIRRMESAITAKVHEIKRRERDLESRVAAEVKSRMAATVGRQ